MKNKGLAGWPLAGITMGHIYMFVSLLMMTQMMMIDENYHDDVDVDTERHDDN